MHLIFESKQAVFGKIRRPEISTLDCRFYKLPQKGFARTERLDRRRLDGSRTLQHFDRVGREGGGKTRINLVALVA